MESPQDRPSRQSPPGVRIRSYEPRDREACARLYVEGLIGGRLAENDTGLDIDDIERAYMCDGSHFWVAETLAGGGEVVGMIGVQAHDRDVAEVRRLRVARSHQRRGIGRALTETAVRFCRDRGYLKVTLDTFIDREPAIGLFEQAGFLFARSRQVGEKEVRHFYLDLYHGEPKPDKAEPYIGPQQQQREQQQQ